MAIYTKRNSAWVPTDGDAISVEQSSAYTCASHTVGWNPGIEGSAGGGGWLHSGRLGSGVGGTSWVCTEGVSIASAGLFTVPKAGLWSIAASIRWAAATPAPFFIRVETFGAVVGQASAIAYPLIDSGRAWVNLDMTWPLLQDQAVGIRACSSAGGVQTMYEARARLHWLSHSYATTPITEGLDGGGNG